MGSADREGEFRSFQADIAGSGLIFASFGAAESAGVSLQAPVVRAIDRILFDMKFSAQASDEVLYSFYLAVSRLSLLSIAYNTYSYGGGAPIPGA